MILTFLLRSSFFYFIDKGVRLPSQPGWVGLHLSRSNSRKPVYSQYSRKPVYSVTNFLYRCQFSASHFHLGRVSFPTSARHSVSVLDPCGSLCPFSNIFDSACTSCFDSGYYIFGQIFYAIFVRAVFLLGFGAMYFLAPRLLQSDRSLEYEQLIELRKEMADLDLMAARLESELASVPDALYSSDSEGSAEDVVSIDSDISVD